MIVDIFTHVLPKPVFDCMEKLPNGFGPMGSRIRSVTGLYDFDARFREMDAAGDYGQIISLSSPPLEEVAGPKEAAEIVRIANDTMAELVARHRDRFPAFVASLALNDVDGALAELDRALGTLGACGIQLFTDVAGRPIDDPAFAPVFAAAAARGTPIWLHPTRTPEVVDFEGEDESRFGLWQMLGWPYATTAAMIRLVLGGLFDRHPDLAIVTHHLGGMVPYHTVRIERGLTRMLKQASERDGKPRRAALDYLRMFYGDTAMHGAVEPTRCGLAFFGAEHVVFATDSPYGSIKAGLDMLGRLGVDAAVRQRIESGNASRLLGKA